MDGDTASRRHHLPGATEQKEPWLYCLLAGPSGNTSPWDHGTGLCPVTKAGVQLAQQEPPELCFAHSFQQGVSKTPPAFRLPLADLEISRAPTLTEGG